jgi:hypothetical protein
MNDQELRSKLVRLAHSKPELREHLLPLLKGAGDENTVAMTPKYALPIKVAATLLVKTMTERPTLLVAQVAFREVLVACTMFAKRGIRDPELTRLLFRVEERIFVLNMAAREQEASLLAQSPLAAPLEP